MSDALILAIDQGTTNTKALLVNGGGEIVARASAPVAIHYPETGWVEQDPLALWESIERAAAECLKQAGGRQPTAVAVSNQRETVAVWERSSGKPAGPCVVWQCHRSVPFCEQLRNRGAGPLLEERTGLTIDPMFSASKARWLLDQIPGGRERASRGGLCVGTIDSWVLWNLTGGSVHACDVTNASRTQLMNLKSRQWDPELSELFGVPIEALPVIRPSSHVFGETRSRGPIPAGLPVCGLIGDSHAAYFAHASFRPGSIKATYGTGSSLMMSVAGMVHSGRGLSATVAFALPGRVTYALEGNIYMTGAAIQWVGEFLGLDHPAEAVAAMAEATPDAEGVYLVPAFAGLGAPHWNDRARGLLTGMTRGSTKVHAARAALESIAYQIHDVFDAMRADAGLDLTALLADGGASRNDALMQFQADILGRPVLRSTSTDLSALGAAYLGGLAFGVWADVGEVEALPRERDRFEPRMAADKREKLLAGWRSAVARAVVEV